MEIPDIKARLNILTLMEKYNLPLDKHHKTCCPFHEEKTPSFTVYPETNTFHNTPVMLKPGKWVGRGAERYISWRFSSFLNFFF